MSISGDNMENLLFNNKSELNDYIRKHSIQCLGLGREGICYLLDNGLVLKKLYNEYYSDFALQFKDINIESFVFAKTGIIINNFINAVFMDYIKGFTILEKIPYDQNILIIAEQLQKLVEDIKKISKLGIIAKDFYPGNIIYNEKGFIIIDTISYLYLNKGDVKVNNLFEIMNKVYDALIKEIYFCKEIPSNLLFMGKIDILENPKEYLKELKLKIEEISQQEVITLGDIKKILNKNR